MGYSTSMENSSSLLCASHREGARAATLKVTLLIVVRNERHYIKSSLNSLIHQTYPRELVDIVIVDGMSNDGTREYLAAQVAELRGKNVTITLLDNEKRTLACGWNIGIQHATGDVICRIDAHSEIGSDYIQQGINSLLNEDLEMVACVGGILKNKGIGFLGELISCLFSSKFGVGNSVFRVGISKMAYTDTAVYGIYWKWVFDRYGYFDDRLARNQDVNLHKRVRAAGWKFLTDPRMEITYYVRTRISALLKKGFSDGYWLAFSGFAGIRHLIPCLFVLYLLALFSTLPILGFNVVLFLPVFLYVILDLYFSYKDGRRLVFKLPLFLVFFMFHFAYGLGTICGFLKNGFCKITCR